MSIDSKTECDGHSLKDALVDRKLHVYIQEEECDVVSRNVVVERERNRMRDHFARISLEIEARKGMCELNSDRTRASFFQRRQIFM